MKDDVIIGDAHARAPSGEHVMCDPNQTNPQCCVTNTCTLGLAKMLMVDPPPVTATFT